MQFGDGVVLHIVPFPIADWPRLQSVAFVLGPRSGFASNRWFSSKCRITGKLPRFGTFFQLCDSQPKQLVGGDGEIGAVDTRDEREAHGAGEFGRGGEPEARATLAASRIGLVEAVEEMLGVDCLRMRDGV